MSHKLKLLIIVLFSVVISITTVYAVTIIASSDVTYDNSKSGSPASNVQAAIDDLYTKVGTGAISKKETLISYITNLAKTDTTNLAYDDTEDKNLRYIGNNPNNYVEFNGEKWRIIGIMNNITDSDGNNASHIKLIRAESMGKIQWDSVNTSSGRNNWSTSSLQTLLNNGDYYNRTNTYSSIGLTDDAKTMISNIVWNIGGTHSGNLTAAITYTDERGTTVYEGYPTTWTGKVGLMYLSDYGYAVGGDVRSTCLNAVVSKYNNNSCYTNDWLYYGEAEWTIMVPSNNKSNVYEITTSGGLALGSKGYTYIVRPTVYLDSNIQLVRGIGTSDDPYKIEPQLGNPDDKSEAAPPKLDDKGKLIPITLDNDGTVIYTSKDDTEWYNYGEKKWANAVILIDSPSKTYKVGDTIKETDIESYFVWIPKYKYKLWNTGTASKVVHEIDIIFDTADTKNVEGKSCKTPMNSGETGSCNNGEYMTHPAFISLGVDGFWIGKFETGYKGATTTSAAEVNSSDSSKIIVKPNVYSWRNNTVYNFFVSAYNYERDLDSHMIKNTEWGAVAYLSHSKYGLGYKININNNSAYKTGYSALPSTNQNTYPGTAGDGASYNQAYNTSIGYLASTTGNITGVYDTSGGCYEYMASYVSGGPGNSGFTTETLANYNTKYFDIYNASSSIATYQYRILGDATGEMGPFQEYPDGDGTKRWHNSWYGGGLSYFVESPYSWFGRGGTPTNGGLSNTFYFSRDAGNAISYGGSRLTLVG